MPVSKKKKVKKNNSFGIRKQKAKEKAWKEYINRLPRRSEPNIADYIDWKKV